MENLLPVNVCEVMIHFWLIQLIDIDNEMDYLFELDSVLVDIDPEDHLRKGHACKPRRHPSLNDYGTPQQIFEDTGFTPDQIRTLLEFFQLPEVYRVPNGGPGEKEYVFTREEVMLFVLKQVREGHSYVEMVKFAEFGGDSRKWSQLMKKFLSDVDPILADYANYRLLERYKDHFPLFATKIADRLAEGFDLQNKETREFEFVPGINISCVHYHHYSCILPQ